MSFNIEFQNRNALTLSQFGLQPNLAWMKPFKEKSLAAFQSNKIPSRKVEHWKYNDMTFLSGQPFELTRPPTQVKIANADEKTSKIDLPSAIEIVFVNGYLITPLSQIKSKINTIDGLRITTFNDTTEQQQQLILSQLAKNDNAKNLLLALNQTINQNGLLIEVDEQKNIQQPIYLRHLNSEQDIDSITSQKTIISLASSSEATIIEQFDSNTQKSNVLSLQQTLINQDNYSQLHHYRLNLESDAARQVSQVQTSLKQGAVLNSFYLGLGSQLNRTDIDVLHEGQNAECHLTGIYLPANQQTIDYHSNIEHRVAHCNTNEIFRGIIADEASATFNGKIHIFQDAQKSDAYLNNKNLLLTNRAEINTKPELEIYADDVVCAHGATVAQLDEQSLYYLQSRGINSTQGKKILSLAFIQELLNQVKLQPVKVFLNILLDQYMSKVS